MGWSITRVSEESLFSAPPQCLPYGKVNAWTSVDADLADQVVQSEESASLRELRFLGL